MSLLELLDHCARNGITFAADGDKLQVRSPEGAMTPELQAQLKKYKAEIISGLRRSGPLVPIARAAKSETQSMSVVQQSLWFLHHMDPGSTAAYNIRKAFILDEAIDAQRWIDSFRAVVDRHETLRCSFAEREARVAATVDVPFDVVDLTHLDAQQQDEELRRRLDDEGRHVFDLTRAPLLRAHLLKLADARWAFIVNAHHLVADAWSAGVLLRELRALYDGRTLPPREYAYRDAVAWQKERIERGELDPSLAYWREQLADLPVLKLPTDFARTTSYEGASESYGIPNDLAIALRAFAREHDVSLYATFLASFAAVLHRFTGQDDFPIGASIAGRTRHEVEDLVGFFADMLVLRMNVTPSMTFADLATHAHRTSTEAFDHQDVPFELVVKAVQPERVIGTNPLFQALFLYLQTDATYEEVQAPSVTSKFDLSLHVEDTGDAFRGLIEYKTGLFERVTIRTLLDAWLQLLHHAIAEPSREVARLQLLTHAQTHDLIYARNEVRESSPPHSTLHEWFESQAAKTPHRIAVKHGHESLTYAQLNDRANARAATFERNTFICLELERSIEQVVSILAVLKAGSAYVPIDPDDPEDRKQFVRNDVANGSPDNRQPTTDNCAYVIYTSGSTGQPKGVVVTHHNVLRLITSTQPLFNFNEHDVWTLFHSYAFDFSVWEIWGALLFGGCVVIVPKLIARSPESFHQLLIDERVTVLNQTPSAFRSLIPIEQTIPSLRYVIFGGEALDLAMLQPWFDRDGHERYGDDRPHLINMYGITETTVHVTHRRITRDDVQRNRGSLIGTRIPDLTLYILDEHLQPVPDHVIGQLHVGGAGLALGYLNREELTRDRFIPHPFIDGQRLYRTGDLARWRSTTDIEYLGRADAQVKIRGFRIELGEIESVIRTHANVRECTVIVREDTPAQKRLVAYFIGDANSADLRALCEQHLPSHMVPTAFVAVESWPRTRNDKLDRARLPLPEVETQSAYVAPRTPIERIIADVWSRVLNAPHVGLHDDFFTLGGDSILSLDVLTQLRQRGIESSVAQLYTHHRVIDLASVVSMRTLDATTLAPFALVSPDNRQPTTDNFVDAYPLSHLQSGMLYEEQLHPDAALYHDIFSFHLRLTLDEQRFTRVLQDAIDRHAVLRTSFDLTQFNEPLQLVHAHALANCTSEDISDLSDDAQERHIAQLIEDERRKPFAYDAPPLLRFYLLKRAADRTQIVFAFHHAILDGWSVATLFSRLLIAYLRPQLAPEPMPSTRFADFIADERKALIDDEPFWRSEVASLTPTIIPRDGAAGSQPAGPRRIVTKTLALDDATSDGLHRAARLANAPLKTAMLAAHLRVLGILTGQAEVVSGVVTNGRPEAPGADRILGLFLNTLPLRVDIGEGTYVDLITRVFDAERRLLAHRRYPMAAAKQLAGGRALFDAAFNFIHFHIYQEVLQSTGLEVLSHAVHEETDFPFLVQCALHPATQKIELTLIYDSSQFTASRIDDIATRYLNVLTAMSSHPLAEFRTKLRSADVPSAGPAASTLPSWFEQQVTKTPHHIAITHESQSLTYAQLNQRADALASALPSNTLIGLAVDRSLDLVISIIAILKAGSAYVPLDPSYPAERLKFIIEDAQLETIITTDAIAQTLPSHNARIVTPDNRQPHPTHAARSITRLRHLHLRLHRQTKRRPRHPPQRRAPHARMRVPLRLPRS